MSQILIIMTWVQIGTGAMTVSMQEFSSGDRCEMARKAFNEQAVFWIPQEKLKDKFQAFCVPK